MKIQELTFFKSNESTHEKVDGPNDFVSAKKNSSVTFYVLAKTARCGETIQQLF